MLGRTIAQYQEHLERAKSVMPIIPSMPSVRRFKPNLHGFNFIILHYLYIISMAIIGSILLYPAGGLDYIDALFFATGSATQGGLNTVDVNTLKLYQQIIIMFIACITNPIFINSFVVFVRLYWFEKRFQNVVRDAKTFRKTRTRTKSEAKGDIDVGREEAGVNGREIKVLHPEDGAGEGTQVDSREDQKEFEVEPLNVAGSSALSVDRESSHGRSDPDEVDGTQQPVPFQRDIMFADEVRTPRRDIANEERIPAQLPREQHIEFVEKQRNPKDRGALRIPGPREFDQGDMPRRVDDDDLDDLGRRVTRDVDSHEQERATRFGPSHPLELNFDDHPLKEDGSDDGAGPTNKLGTVFSAFKPRKGATTDQEKDQENGDEPMKLHQRGRTRTMTSFINARSRDHEEHDPLPYLSYAATMGRNSAFVDLTEEQREELGGIEYRSLKTLAWVLICYFFGFHLLGLVVFTPWIVRDKGYSALVKRDGASPAWWGIFTPASMFNDLGFTLTPDSMVSFQRAVLPLLVGAFLIVIGNTGFPCMLRLVIWLVSKCVPYRSSVWEELQFLLDHPRRCFTLLFPQKATWWLFAILVGLNAIDLLFFIILDLNDSTVTSLPVGIRLLDGLFQAAATRTAGFAVVNLADLHPGIQVSYLVMMYISVLPIAISVRRTNVYEEKSLGIYPSADDAQASDGPEPSYISSHLRRQLSFDLWYIFLGLFLICVIEGGRLENINEPIFTIFSVLFEIISAYGTVGLSLGYTGINASFSAEFKPLSKLIIIAMMIRGRHRGLPYALDRAILLPSESLAEKEAADALKRAARRANTGLTDIDGETPISPQQTAGGRRGSTATLNGRPVLGGIKRIVTGALSAGPSAKRGKRA